MNRDPENQSAQPGADLPEDQLRSLLQLAGERASPDQSRKAADKARLRETWQAAVEKNRRLSLMRFAAPLAVAASLVLVTTLLLQLPAGAPTVIGELVRTQGGFTHQRANDDAPPSSLLHAGDLLVTQGDDATVTARMLDQTIIHLAGATQLTMQKNNDLWLHQGRIFIDSPGIGDAVRIRTAWGTIEDIGTQFEVTAQDDVLELAMREGRAVLTFTAPGIAAEVADSRIHDADVVRVNTDLEVERSVVSTTADRWHWLRRATPAFPAGTHPLSGIVGWAARQTGRQLAFDSQITELELANEHVTWPAIELASVESQLATLSMTGKFRLVFSANTIKVTVAE